MSRELFNDLPLEEVLMIYQALLSAESSMQHVSPSSAVGH